MSRETRTVAEVLNRVVTHTIRALRRVDDAQGVGRARLSALSVLVFGGQRTLSALAADEGVTVATMHHVVAGLVAEKLARRTRDPDDRRKAVIEATAKGRALMTRARAARLDLLEERLAALAPAELATVRRAMELLDR